jgi:serine/threonine protein kinase
LPLRGERLKKPSYSHLRTVGEGAVADAWICDHDIYGTKVVQKRYSTIGLEDAAAFREPRILQRIKHDHIVRVLEAQWDPEQAEAITFVTVYCEGRSIAKALEDDYRFSVGQALVLTRHLLSALAYAHTDPGLKIVHRDVKPGNGFLSEDRRTLYLGDWGSAAEMDAAGTVAGIEGTLLYMPPEGGPPDGRLGVTGDIYGAALTLFEMLCGALPYAEMDPVALDRRVTRGLPALPPAAFVFAPHVSGQVRAIVRKGMRPKPETRFQKASDFITAINAVNSIDWCHVAGEDMDGQWEGTFPMRLPEHRRRRYSVDSYILGGGKDRGRRRLEARQAVSVDGKLARFGVEDETVDASDRAALERFFAAVEASAAQRAPARW